ncbi:flagellar basal body-associated protein FliL [Alteromonas sp. 5E99-2]|uniref:flagellar basal body-associated protein FliL n=1 Tax=Alteromonas sp. 5E99-2 TaxID=2817683 RepID=UPI001A995F13|nr:flagellar basal body-associated protein FliL [Alteromonas sp. 5E99-2]MBO1255224.1 flagellar basal body-associated protein FliL [Alteromonas sp. 5E99-2]
MADEELQIEDGGKKSKLPLIIIIAVVVLLGGGAAAYFLLFSGSDDVPEQMEEVSGEAGQQAPAAEPQGAAQTGSALYVAMPRPFVFNVPGTGRARLVQIKVQLMMRGSENEELAKSHIPLIEGTLLQVFSAGNADELVTESGKLALRDNALTAVQERLQELAGGPVVEQVLFTGFVMQ